MLIRRIACDETAPSLSAPQAFSIWAIVEGRCGDDRQVLALATALHGPVRIVQLEDTVPEVIAGRALNTLGLHAPWHKPTVRNEPYPDLLIAAGGRSATLARWLKQASHGKTKVVILGRPWARLSDFDLVVTTPQYGLPDSPNVQMNLLPLNHVEPDRMAAAASHWDPVFRRLPKPWIGALVGGNSGSFRMTLHCAERMARRLNELARETGGSVLLATSPRTPAGSGERLASLLDCPSHIHLWGYQGENPYLGIIALADRFVVTDESASMIAEAANTGQELELLELKERLRSRILAGWLPDMGLGWVFRLGARTGYWTPPRNMRRLHAALRTRGLIGTSAAQVPTHRMLPIEWDLARTVARIAQLYAPERMLEVRSTFHPTAFADQAG
jgi:uncharacterized protein